MALGIIGLLLGIAVLIFVSYRGYHAVPTSLLAGAVVLIFNGVNLWTGFAESWIGGMASVFTNYYLLFLASSLFANIMRITGSCEKMANKFVDWFGKKHILTVLSIFCFLMCYGGISFFVVMFVIGPLAFSLFKELNIPRKMIIVVVATGGGAFVLAAPGSTQIQNVIPSALGTNLMAAPIMGALITIIGMVISIMFTEYYYKREMAKVESGESEGWIEEAGSSVQMAEKREKLPNAFCAFLPLAVVIGMIIICSFATSLDATMLAVIAMCIATVLNLLININYLEGGRKSSVFKNWLVESATGSAGSALVLGAVVGFGTLVSSTDSFATIVSWLMGLDISTYWKGVISTGVIAGICGSASSGSQLTMQYLGDYFIASGANLDILHRLIANASITFDALPHATGCFLMLSYFGLNHKIAYKYIFMLDVVIPVVIVAVFTFICTLMY